MHASCTGILPQRNAHLMDQFRVPAGSSGHPAGKQRAAGIIADTLRPVGHPDFRDAQPRYGYGMEPICSTAQQTDFFVQRQLRNQFRSVLPVLPVYCLGAGGQTQGQKTRQEDCSDIHRIPYFLRMRRIGLRTERAHKV